MQGQHDTLYALIGAKAPIFFMLFWGCVGGGV